MTSWPAGSLAGVALAVTAAGLVAAVVTLLATRSPLLAVTVLLDFLLAAGLLRLTGDPAWVTVATAAAVMALRRLIGLGLRAGRPLTRSAAPRPRRGGPTGTRRA